MKSDLRKLLTEFLDNTALLQEKNIMINKIELSLNELNSIRVIQGLENPTMGTIANEIGITLGTLTSNIKKMLELLKYNY